MAVPSFLEFMFLKKERQFLVFMVIRWTFNELYSKSLFPLKFFQLIQYSWIKCFFIIVEGRKQNFIWFNFCRILENRNYSSYFCVPLTYPNYFDWKYRREVRWLFAFGKMHCNTALWYLYNSVFLTILDVCSCVYVCICIQLADLQGAACFG